MWDGWAKLQAIRVGEWKLYFDKVKDIRDSSKGRVLINLAEDITETTDVSEKYPDKVKAMLDLARKQLAEIKQNSMRLGGPEVSKRNKKVSAWLED